MTYSTHTIHLEPTDTLTVERDSSGIIGGTVRDHIGRTVARVEFLGRPEQLHPVALAAADSEAVRA